MNPMIWLTKASPFLRRRAIWAAVFALAALVIRAASPAPPPRSPEGVAAMLGAAVGGEVRADDFVWEARGGFWSDAFLGRRVLFVAKKPGAAGADIYRARVRLTRAGQPISIGVVRNLTQSPLGDDRDLVALGHHAAYLTRAFGAVQGVTLLDLDGDGRAREERGAIARAAAAIEGWLATGSASGIGRTEITFGLAPAEAKHELQGDLLVLALGSEGSPAALDTREGSLSTGPSNAFAAGAQRIPRHPTAIGAVAAALTRELLGDTAARATRAIAGVGSRPVKRAPLGMPKGEPPSGPADAEWPPPPISPVIRPPLAGEGAWIAGPAKRLGDAPASIVEAAIRPDPQRPEAVVRLAAIDTRQLDLRLAAGVDEPRSPLGLHGSGAAPDVPAERIVATFAGGPAELRGDEQVMEPGFVADRRVLVPPAAGLPTLAIAADGQARLGPWPEGGDPGAASIRQFAYASLGQTASIRVGDAMERSALGLTKGGQLIYAWGANVTADTLRRALDLASCTYAVPLAAGPAVGLTYHSADRPEKKAGSDLFYAVLRSVAPQAAPGGGPAFAADGGKQPSPAWLPAVQKATVTSLGAQVHVTTFAPGRVAFRIRAGAREPQTKAVAALPTSLPDADRARIIAALGLGSGKRKGARGLSIEGAVGLPIRGDDTGVLAFDSGRARVLRARDEIGEHADATELPLTADDGKLRPASRDVGTMRPRASACVLPDGSFAVASTTFDSDEATTTALLDLGCTRVVALDRGSHQPAFLHRAGGEQAPEPRYDATVIFALEMPLSGRAGPL